jgi:hypothetical protein
MRLEQCHTGNHRSIANSADFPKELTSRLSRGTFDSLVKNGKLVIDDTQETALKILGVSVAHRFRKIWNGIPAHICLQSPGDQALLSKMGNGHIDASGSGLPLPVLSSDFTIDLLVMI